MCFGKLTLSELFRRKKLNFTPRNIPFGNPTPLLVLVVFYSLWLPNVQRVRGFLPRADGGNAFDVARVCWIVAC